MSSEAASIGGRIQFVSDTLLPATLFSLLFLRKPLKIGFWACTVVIGLLIFSSLLSYSRFFWMQTSIALLLGLANLRKDKIGIVYVCAMCVTSLYFFDWLALLMNDRFSALVAGSSDADRISQIKALGEFFWDAPWLGHGLGTFTTRSIRNVEAPFSYEVQILALSGQIGLIGVSFFLTLLIYYCRRLFVPEKGQICYRVCLVILLVTTLAGGLANPYLLNSTAAINYGMLMILGMVNVNKAKLLRP